jgi:hypothetical protein
MLWIRVLLIQGGIGLAWLLGDPTRTASKSYQPAIQLGELLGFGWYPVRGYGLLLCVIALGLAWALHSRRDNAIRNWSLALAAFWTFWACMFFAAIFTANGGIASMFFAGGLAWYALDRALSPGVLQAISTIRKRRG